MIRTGLPTLAFINRAYEKEISGLLTSILHIRKQVLPLGTSLRKAGSTAVFAMVLGAGTRDGKLEST